MASRQITKERSKLDKEYLKLEQLNSQIDDTASQRKRAGLMKKRRRTADEAERDSGQTR